MRTREDKRGEDGYLESICVVCLSVLPASGVHPGWSSLACKHLQTETETELTGLDNNVNTHKLNDLSLCLCLMIPLPQLALLGDRLSPGAGPDLTARVKRYRGAFARPRGAHHHHHAVPLAAAAVGRRFCLAEVFQGQTSDKL